MLTVRTATVETISRKKLFYVVVSQGDTEVAINVGEGTYKKVQALETGKEEGAKLVIEEGAKSSGKGK